MKNFNDTIGNRTLDLPACSAVPQTTAAPRAPNFINKSCISVRFLFHDMAYIASNRTTFVLIMIQIESANGHPFADIDSIVPVTKLAVSLQFWNK